MSLWVGCNGVLWVPFSHKETPTYESHGSLYYAVIGPFRTKRGQEFMAKYGQNNPRCLCVADAERLSVVE
jgi:hypothetical protein